MKKVLIINGHEKFGDFAQGDLNNKIIDLADSFFKEKGFEIKHSVAAQEFDVKEEVAKHMWADLIFVQAPLYWMSVPAAFKNYMDQVYTGGIDGELCDHDGRTRSDENAFYGMGGLRSNTHYMLSVTMNAPESAFNSSEPFFEGKSVDDLYWPVHLNFKFFGMKPLQTFVMHDVYKNPSIEKDLARLPHHLENVLVS
ncbi:flavodoxin [Paraphotobacterium marinum]|uniref:Flavodoxin n=1 Tax=Paraphotobacterium marinum TaxID=1755811 RepID=A0A220VG18_9GAMM|nr:NAD(P)H-dependent oxidoreductase [Paraphotobacterium marinum]ASK79334.1 flavodoxin [Paraphotobacterium marinum]